MPGGTEIEQWYEHECAPVRLWVGQHKRGAASGGWPSDHSPAEINDVDVQGSCAPAPANAAAGAALHVLEDGQQPRWRLMGARGHYGIEIARLSP